MKKHPIVFRSANVFIEKDLDMHILKSIPSEYIYDLLSSIPYQTSKMVYEVNPKDKYNLTIINEYGNCSNLTYDAIYKLLKDSISFYIVHYYPFEGWKRGNGHTIMILKIDGEDKIVDYLEGGIISNLNKENIFSPNQPDLKFQFLNNRKDSINPYFSNVFNYPIGFIEDNKISDYYNFLNIVYINLGNSKVEIHIYSSLALLTGFYPKIISNSDMLLSSFEQYKFYLIWFRLISVAINLGFFFKIKNMKN